MDMYFVAVVLPPDLNEKVFIWKQYMFQQYKCAVGLKSPAHITIIPPFWMHPDKEDEFISEVDLLSAQIQPFPIATNNFSAFKPRTLFIDVKENHDLINLKSKASNFFAGKEYKIKLENRPFYPHITIATRDLYKKDFYEAWPLFENKEFGEEWQAEGLSILRHNKKNWDVIYTSQFLI